MAGNVPDMDFEEGELADSESDTEAPAAQEEDLKEAAKPVPPPLDLLGAVGGIAVLNNNNTIPAVQFTGHRTGGSNLMGGARGTGQPTYSKGMTMAYRESRSTTSYSSDEDSHDSYSDDEDETLWRRKRMRCVENQPGGAAYAFHHTPVIKSPPKRKINNIWASVVQEQFSESVADELVYTGLTGGISKERGPESYDYKEFTEHVSDSDHGSKSPIMTSEDEDRKEDHQDEKEEDAGEQEEEEEKGTKRKRSVKERLGPRPGTPFPGGPITVTADDPPEKVADEIIYRLSEPKWHLIHRIVKVLGAAQALKLLSMTEDVEAAGGMPINDGTRRRTPGGVFIQLLKSAPAITKEQRDKIFADEDRKFQERQKEERRRRRRNNRSRKRRGHAHASENDRMEEDGTDCADAQPTSVGQDSILHDMENIPEETAGKQAMDKPPGMVEEEEGEVLEEEGSGECKMAATQGEEAKENVAEISLELGENDMDL
ncbi:PHAX [Branchiostoma lanceolatum]|uniref:Phosphorylated adapter RNA export protein n=1 Tax=Branchiostoma lanceolatum TaxID=7740 RepID=A0A8J9ZJW4_BRALA|nr:PHAX [Branchiostoma lanceolatum]